MDSFECRKALEYALRYIKNLEDYESIFLQSIGKILAKEINSKEIIQLDLNNLTSYKLLATRKKLIKVVNAKLKELPTTESTFEKKCKLISKIYRLENDEYEYLIFYILKTANPIIKHIAETFTDEFTLFGSFGLNLPNWVIDSKRKSLIRKGILVKYVMNTGKLVLSSKILKIFENPKIKTATQIKNKLLGKNQKSELVWKDFEHLKKDRDIAFNILTSAVQTQAKGINILLYGSVGTGKTQLAKLLANKAKIDMYAVSAEFMDKEASRKDRLSDLASKQTILAKTNNSCILFDEA